MGFGQQCYLDPVKVRAARIEELEWVESADLFDLVRRSTAISTPIALKWVETNKGDHIKVKYRSRLVLRDTKARHNQYEQLESKYLFSSMPPLEAFRALLLLIASKREVDMLCNSSC